MSRRVAGVLGAAALALAGAAAAASALPGPLVTPEWLAAHRAAVTVLDVREDAAGSPAGLGDRIPGSLLVEYSDLRVERLIDGRKIPWMLPDAQHFQAIMRKAGVPAGKPIVIVTPATVPEDLDTAARVYWSLKVYGDDDLAILDGGLARWLAEGRAVETRRSAGGGVAPGDWAAGAPRTEILADSEQVADAAKRGVQLIDARPPAYYFGLAKKPFIAAAGHIGEARDFPAELHARAVDGSQRFLTPAQYRDILESIGVRPDQPVIAYCNTGHMAAGAWFIASELLGDRHAALYDGSMARWAAEGRPVVAAQ